MRWMERRWRDSSWQPEPHKDRARERERDCSGMGGWMGGLLWDARTQWHDTDALCNCARSRGEEGIERQRRRRRGGWVCESSLPLCSVSTLFCGENRWYAQCGDENVSPSGKRSHIWYCAPGTNTQHHDFLHIQREIISPLFRTSPPVSDLD